MFHILFRACVPPAECGGDNAKVSRNAARRRDPSPAMIRAIIFDLGNVLLHFDHRLIARRLEQGARRPEGKEHGDFIRLTEEFETGAVSPEEFHAAVVRAWELSGAVDLPTFSRLWSDIFWKNEELVPLLPDLARRHRLVLLSNTNVLHIEYARARFPEVFVPFHSCVLSHEAGMRKPDPRIFAEALARTGAAPDETLYFDDIKSYVDAASRLGIRAHQFVSTSGLTDTLRAYDIC